MNVERNLPIIRERKQAILKGDMEKCAQQKKEGCLLARERVDLLLDAGSFTELDVLASNAGVITGYGTIDACPVYVYAQDCTVRGGSVGMAHARKVLKVMSLAEKTGAPLVAILDTRGARLDEGVDALNAYAVMAGGASRLSGVVPQIALVLGPCGGIASSIASMSDITVMSSGGSLFVNGPKVVAAVSGKDVEMAEFAGMAASMRSGVSQISCESEEAAIAETRRLVAMLPANNLDEAIVQCADDPARECALLNEIAPDSDIRSILTAVSDGGDILELSEGFAPSIVTALGRIGGTTVGFVANQPARDGGRLTVYGCKKASRFIAFCDSFSIPVISVVDSMGVKISTAPQGELTRASAQLMYALTSATTARIALIAGSAVGMSYAALCSRAASDMVLAWPGAVVSAVTPKIAVQLDCAEELKTADDPFEKRAELEQKYMDDVADGVHAAEKGYVDDVIEPAQTRQYLAKALDMLSGKREATPARKHGNMPL